MSQTRHQFLNRIQTQLKKALLPEAQPEHPGPFQANQADHPQSAAALVDAFSRELEALSGHLHRPASRAETVETILAILEQHETKRVLAWDELLGATPGLAEGLDKAGIKRVEAALPVEEPARTVRLAELDQVTVGLTGAQGGLADTGAVALLSGPGRSRLASLLPPVHIAVLSAAHLYASLPDFLAARPELVDQGSNLVFVAGPSRTADIEQTLSIGVHGPGEIHVILEPEA